MDDKFLEVIEQLDNGLYFLLRKVKEEYSKQVNEIRIRINKPLLLYCGSTYFFVNTDSSLSKYQNRSKIVTQQELNNSIRRICDFSRYTYQNQIKDGYITLKGGHRAGISGTGVLSENGTISNIKDISSINIRIAKQVIGAADLILRNRISINVPNILIVGAPGSGKTTILRDLARSLSIGKNCIMKKVSVVDQRNEIAAVSAGKAGFDLGLCDILDGYPKAQGMLQAIKSLSPEIIVCDEIGNLEEAHAIKQCLNAGAKVIASMHAESIEELFNRDIFKVFLKSKTFDEIVLLNKEVGKILGIYKVDDLIDKVYRSCADNQFIYRGRL